jgi:hypothetical protein
MHRMTHQLLWIERQHVTGTKGRASAIQCEAAALRRDINEAQTLIDRLQRNYLDEGPHAQVRRPVRHELAEPGRAQLSERPNAGCREGRNKSSSGLRVPPHAIRGNDLAMKPNLAPTTGATLVDESDNIGAILGAFDGPEWRIKHTPDHGRRTDIVVSVMGLQYVDGPALREIMIDCPDTPIIAPAEARKLGTALIAAADAAFRGNHPGVDLTEHRAEPGRRSSRLTV